METLHHGRKESIRIKGIQIQGMSSLHSQHDEKYELRAPVALTKGMNGVEIG